MAEVGTVRLTALVVLLAGVALFVLAGLVKSARTRRKPGEMKA